MSQTFLAVNLLFKWNFTQNPNLDVMIFIIILLKNQNFSIYNKAGQWDSLDAVLLDVKISNWGSKMTVCYISFSIHCISLSWLYRIKKIQISTYKQGWTGQVLLLTLQSQDAFQINWNRRIFISSSTRKIANLATQIHMFTNADAFKKVGVFNKINKCI